MADSNKNKQRSKLLNFFRRKQMVNVDRKRKEENPVSCVDVDAPSSSSIGTLIPECEFECPCCHDVLQEPTTLPCGHNFCRLCLARTYYMGSTSKKLCPVCREPWQYVPSINTLLRSTVESLFPNQCVEKRRELDNSPEALRLLKRFNSISKGTGGSERVQANYDVFVTGIMWTVILATFVYILWTLVHLIIGSSEQVSNTNSSTEPPLTSEWSHNDVMSWLEMLGPWTNGTIKEQFEQNNIDGKSLLEMAESDLPHFNIFLPFHQKLFWNAVENLRYNDERKIGNLNLWTYIGQDSSHHRRVVLYFFGLSDFPRLSLFYLYYCEYASVVRPFLRATYYIKAESNVDTTAATSVSTAALDSEQKWMVSESSFVIQTLFIPYLLVFKFCWLWSSVHSFTMCCLMYTTLAKMYTETHWILTHATSVTDISLFMVVASNMKPKLYKYIILCALYPIIPNIIYDLIFYCLLYLPPVCHFIKTIRSGLLSVGFTWDITLN